MKPRILAAFATGVLLAAFVACGSGAKSSLVGRWQMVNSAGDVNLIELNADGSAGFSHSFAGCTGMVSLLGFTWSADAMSLTIRVSAPRCVDMMMCPDARDHGCGFGGPEVPQPYTLSGDSNTLTLSGTAYARVR